MHYPTDKVIYTKAFVNPVVENWLMTDRNTKESCEVLAVLLVWYLGADFSSILYPSE